jgi:hypothetical protein
MWNLRGKKTIRMSEGKRGMGIRKENGVSMVKVHNMHAWKCHNETHYFVLLILLMKNKRHCPK